MKYAVVISRDPEEGVYNVDVPSLPGCHTWGKTRREAVRNAKDAILTYVDAMKAAGKPLPAPGDVSILKVTA
jgi:predicted RNase H-like HicB family nuclease